MIFAVVGYRVYVSSVLFIVLRLQCECFFAVDFCALCGLTWFNKLTEQRDVGRPKTPLLNP